MLALEGLSRRFGDVTALDDVGFDVPTGSLTGFVGANGAGKTTTMRIVLGVLEPDAGSITWQDRPVDAAARMRFGYMPEERGLYPKMRVRDQLAYMAAIHGASTADAGHAADRWIDRLGLSERADTPVEELSLGNQQRVQLGAALVHEPDLLVLDEPFSGLDPVGVDVLAGVLSERAENGAAVVFSSHQLELVERLCRSVTIIDDGRVVASGEVGELRRLHGADTLSVTVEGAPAEWWAGIDGVGEWTTDGDTVNLAVGTGLDDQAVLAAATNAGRVKAFGRAQPSLTDVFRDTVSG